MSRKIFNHDNKSESKIIAGLGNKHLLYENSISACGCLFYRVHDAKLQLLLISYSDPGWPRLDDLGGKIDEKDVSIIDAISRETSEETNGVISEEFMRTHLLNETNTFYNKQSKYYVVVSRVDEKFHPNTSVFGDFEQTDKIHRVINWIDYTSAKPKLAIRLLCNVDLMEYFDNLSVN
jgi:predicted NUDIX family NTP pyrophosphohydrolase